MKIRHILIILTSLFIIIILVLSYSIGRQNGISYGVKNYEDIKLKQKKRKQPKTIAKKKDTKKYVNVLKVTNKEHTISLKGHGKVNASTSINISTEVQGKLKSNIKLKKGTRFTKGQVLFYIENLEVKLALQSKKSGFLTLLTSVLPDLNIDYPESYNNWKIFFEKIDVTKPLPILPNFRTTKEKSFVISKDILRQYYSIKSDEERLNKHTIKAPFSGSIIESYTDEGATVYPNSNIIKILRDGKLEIEIPILSHNIKLIKIGQKVNLKEKESFDILGKITRVGNYINPTTQTFSAFVEINNKKDISLYNGMYLEAIINCNTQQFATKIPRSAVFDDNFVFTLEGENKLKKVKVTITTYQDKYVLVSNLKDNTLVVKDAIVNAKEGSKIVILNKSEI